MKKTIAIIGGGPAGLMAAEILSARNFDVWLFERKPTVGRKFLMAGRGGLNLTHSEDLALFMQRYGEQSATLEPAIEHFSPTALRSWCEDLGEPTFIGTSGRVFPKSFKASPLLRAWIARLEAQGVRFMLHHDWQGWDKDALLFNHHDAPTPFKADATLLALGGASWPRLGADGSWVSLLKGAGIDVAPLRPANCGFFARWSPVFSQRFAGQPLKSVGLSFEGRSLRGEFMITENGVEGGAIYMLSSALREAIHANGHATLMLDLKPDLSVEVIAQRLEKPRKRLSLANYLRKTLNLSDVAIGLLMERPDRSMLGEYPAAQLAQYIKSYALELRAPFSMERAISTAGGVSFNEIDERFMLRQKPGVFVAGEMLDWEAPTGGYLLQGCMASGAFAARGMIDWLGGAGA